jgi:hypothetical protein
VLLEGKFLKGVSFKGGFTEKGVGFEGGFKDAAFII